MVHCYAWRDICSSLFLEVCSVWRTRGMGFGLLNVVHNYASLKYTEVNQGCSDAKSCMHADIVSFNAFENWCNFQGWNKSSVLVSWINATCDCPIVQYLVESYGEWITVVKTSLRATHFNPPPHFCIHAHCRCVCISPASHGTLALRQGKQWKPLPGM